MSPLQQHGAQAVLEIGDGLAHGGLRQVQALGRAAEPARFHDRLEAAELVTFNLHAARRVALFIGLVHRLRPSSRLMGASLPTPPARPGSLPTIAPVVAAVVWWKRYVSS